MGKCVIPPMGSNGPIAPHGALWPICPYGPNVDPMGPDEPNVGPRVPQGGEFGHFLAMCSVLFFSIFFKVPVDTWIIHIVLLDRWRSRL